jgi:hypothetical protein
VRESMPMAGDSFPERLAEWHLTFWCRIVLTSAQERWRRQLDFPMHRHSVLDGSSM